VDVRIDRVAVSYGSVDALRGVSIGASHGGSTVLVGPNGAGKSTLMSVVLGLLRPDRGEVLADGEVVACARHGATREFRARLGYLPEAVAFSENLTGRQVLRFFASARGVGRKRVEATLERVGLDGAAGRAVRGYSRGMRQRLGLGVAVLHTPDLLVLDEPTGGLDQEGLSVLWEVLAEWKAAGRSVLMSTHEIALVERHADTVCVLADGRVRAVATPDALRREAALPVRVSVELAEEAAAAQVASGLRDRHAGVEHEGRNVGLLERPEELLEVMRAVSLPTAPVRHVRVEEPGLDEVTLRILGGSRWDASPVH